MGYALNDGIVEGNLFVRRPDSEGFSGKWKYTIALDMTEYWDCLGPADAVLAAYRDGKADGVVKGATGFWLVVLEPYHKNGYPVMVAV
jgi:hypothetical protein